MVRVIAVSFSNSICRMCSPSSSWRRLIAAGARVTVMLISRLLGFCRASGRRGLSLLEGDAAVVCLPVAPRDGGCLGFGRNQFVQRRNELAQPADGAQVSPEL